MPWLSVPSSQGGGLLAQQAEGGVPLVHVDSIAVTGNSRLLTAVIIGAMGIQPGPSVSYREIQRGIKDLYATGQFNDIIIRAEGSDDNPPIILTLEVQERDIISRITFSGLEHVDEGTVQDTTGLTTGQPYSPSKILAAKDFIRAELATAVLSGLGW